MDPKSRRNHGVCCAAINELLTFGEQLPETRERATKLRHDLHDYLGTIRDRTDGALLITTYSQCTPHCATART